MQYCSLNSYDIPASSVMTHGTSCNKHPSEKMARSDILLLDIPIDNSQLVIRIRQVHGLNYSIILGNNEVSTLLNVLWKWN